MVILLEHKTDGEMSILAKAHCTKAHTILKKGTNSISLCARATHGYKKKFRDHPKTTSPLRGREEGVKNGVLREFLGLKLRRQGEGGGLQSRK